MARGVVLAFLVLSLLAAALGQTGSPATGAPATGSPATGTPATGSPATGAPATGSPATGSPATGSPATGAPATGSPSTGSPATGSPATGTPSTGSPATGAPATGSPATSSPSTGTPSTGAPATGTPTTSRPSTASPSLAPTPNSGSGSGAGAGSGANNMTNYTLSYNSYQIKETDLPCPKGPGHCPRTWNYTDAAQWGCYCPEYSTCSSGMAQSPVDVFAPANPTGCVDFSVKACGLTQNRTCLFNTGNYFVAPVDANTNARFTYNGRSYVLRKVEFHTPAQHYFSSERPDLEVMYYYDSPVSYGKTLVTSFFFTRPDNTTDPNPATSPFLEQFVYKLPEFSDCSCGNGRTEFLGDTSRFYGINETCDQDGYNNNGASSPACCRNNCTKPYCGDGIVDSNEACDNGSRNSNTTSGACRLTCCLPACGDGIVDPGEDCDDGNNLNFDGCSSICRTECGNGIFDPQREQCDNGTLNSNTAADACRNNCRLPFCGDGVVDAGEQCDNGTRYGSLGINPSQCRFNCTNPYCGDGYTDNNEECDDGADNGANTRCSTTCTTNCGNGVVDGIEECDDGPLNSNVPNSHCRTNCLLQRCGDGIVDDLAGEQCDSIELVNPWADTALTYYTNYTNIYCSANCSQLCGNGRADPGEECDHGCYNADLPNRCRTNCEVPSCGDGIVDLEEECDAGYLNGNVSNACRSTCVVPKCGDGIVDSLNGEQCDDGNRREGDGCDPMCRNECGNGFLDAGEECDYGALNANAPDSCRLNCRLPVCGDGILDHLEHCDNGARNGNTSNLCRLNCTLPFCGDGVIDWQYGEKCDFGANNSDTTEGGCSLFCIPNYCRQRCYNTSVDWSSIAPSNMTAYAYNGSLAYPPCSEGFDYLLFADIQPLSNFQYTTFAGPPHGAGGARPPQALNGRRFSRPCRPAPAVCGNGIQEAGEQCDMGLNINSDYQSNRCRTNCTLPVCGDGVTDRGEECDDGQFNGGLDCNRRCTSSCTLFPRYTNPYVVRPWNYNNTCTWAYQTPMWATCATDRPGAQQSPININTTWSSLIRYGPAVQNMFGGMYASSPFTVVWTGRHLSVVFGNATSDRSNTMSNNFTDNGKTFFLNQVNFHVPSEHTVDGYHADVEADLWHTAADGSHAVVAVLFNVSRTMRSTFFSEFEFYLPRDYRCRYGNGLPETALAEECDDGPMNSDSKPNACRLMGRLPHVGDGVVDRGEQCDNGPMNAYKPDACRPNGRLPCCGDGIVDSGEECDWGLTPVTCSTQCTLYCGDGIVDSFEQCDNGTLNNNVYPGPSQCRTNCSLPYCGDGVCDPNEQCDDGIYNSDFVSGACRTNCRVPYCGDAIVDYSNGEECDAGAGNTANGACLPNCTLNCGSGNMPAGTTKQCDMGDDNSNAPNALCRTNCVPRICGDGIIDNAFGEECDSTPGCSSTCTLLCGNGVTDAGEQCDNGTLNDDTTPNACRTTCMIAHCGDGVKECNEECDFGTQNSRLSNAPCRPNCTLPRCGDGVADSNFEECDDGNNLSNDGCSSTCHWECGNGMMDMGEICDDGEMNAMTGNACRPRGFMMNGVNMGCTFGFCGDGILDAGEQCDDGARNGGSGNLCRANCTLPYCGDGIVDSYYGEWCDNGASNNDFSGTCSTTCQLNNCGRISGRSFNLARFFSNVTSPIVKYNGSWSEPPCTEGVTYYVLTKTQPIALAQYQALASRINGNNREVQPLNNRTPVYYPSSGAVCGNCVLEDGEECDMGDSNNNGMSCRANCTKPRCGDGILDADEQCDMGAANGATGPCNQFCKFVTTCPASPCNKGSSCPSCVKAGDQPTTCCNGGSNEASVNNSGTLINVNFASLLAGAGCRGGNCQ